MKKEYDFWKEFKNVIATEKSFSKNNEESEIRKKIFVIHCACHMTAFTQATGYFIQQNAFPYLTKILGISPQMYGYLMSFTSVLQLIGGPLCGRLGDMYGGRLPLLISFASSALSFALKGCSYDILFLAVATLPLIMAHALQSTYIVLSDITTKFERAESIGKLGVSHGLGMIVGSPLGGLITDKLGCRFAFFTGSLVTCFCIGFTLFLIPKNTNIIRKQINKKNENIYNNKIESKTIASFLGFKEILEVCKMRHVGYVLILKVITGFPFSILTSMFTFVLMDYYKLGPKDNGMVLSYMGVVGMVTQGLLIGYLNKKFIDASLIFLSLVLMTISFLFLIISESVYIFCVILIPLTIGGSLFHVIVTSLITKIVRDNQTGAALGLAAGSYTIMKSISPSIGGFFYSQLGFFSFGVLGYIVDFIVIIYLSLYGRNDFN